MAGSPRAGGVQAAGGSRCEIVLVDTGVVYALQVVGSEAVRHFLPLQSRSSFSRGRRVSSPPYN